MKIDPDRLRYLRKNQKLSLVKLAEKTKRVNSPGITEKTIQRLEVPSQQNTAVREHTIESLVKALNVEPGVLTGDLPLPESDKAPPDDNLERVQIGAQIAPKTRLAYDLIKRRYGISATDIINMAPLFFVLLAEDSLAQRRKKLDEAKEAIGRLEQIDGFWHGSHAYGEQVIYEGIEAEEESIAKADLFGEHLLDDDHYHRNAFFDEPFDITKENPFVHYLRKLANELAISGVVDVDGGDLNMASNFKFPHYDICREELDHIANDSLDAKRALETGFARLSEIPEERMAEDAGEERAKWLEERLPDILKKIPEKEKGNVFAKFIATSIATSPKGDEMKEALEKFDSQKTNSETDKEGDDQ